MMSRHIYYVLSSFWHLSFTFVPQQKISNRSWYKSRLINLSGEWRLAVHWLQRAVVCIASQVINKMVNEEEFGYIILYKLKNLKKSCAYAFAFCLVFYTLPLRLANPRYSCPLIFLILSCFSARDISLKKLSGRKVNIIRAFFCRPGDLTSHLCRLSLLVRQKQ